MGQYFMKNEQAILYLCVCVCIYVCLCISVCVHVNVCAYICVCAHMYMGVCVCMDVGGSEVLQELALSFHFVGPRNQTQDVRLGGNCHYLLSHFQSMDRQLNIEEMLPSFGNCKTVNSSLFRRGRAF